MSPDGGRFDEKEVFSSKEKEKKTMDLLSWGSVERRKLMRKSDSRIPINLSSLPPAV